MGSGVGSHSYYGCYVGECGCSVGVCLVSVCVSMLVVCVSCFLGLRVIDR